VPVFISGIQKSCIIEQIYNKDGENDKMYKTEAYTVMMYLQEKRHDTKGNL
jgi:hypothetical protein